MINTNKFIAFQILILVVINYLFLIDSGLIFGKSLSPALLIFMCIFNFGNFSVIGFLSQTRKKSKKELIDLMYVSLLVNVLFVALCCFYNCAVKTEYLIWYYLLGTFLSAIFYYYLNQAYNSIKHSNKN